jgi:hypothetical protein
MLIIAARVYKTPDKKTLFINFEKVGQKYRHFSITCSWSVGLFYLAEAFIFSERSVSSSPISW